MKGDDVTGCAVGVYVGWVLAGEGGGVGEKSWLPHPQILTVFGSSLPQLVQYCVPGEVAVRGAADVYAGWSVAGEGGGVGEKSWLPHPQILTVFGSSLPQLVQYCVPGGVVDRGAADAGWVLAGEGGGVGEKSWLPHPQILTVFGSSLPQLVQYCIPGPAAVRGAADVYAGWLVAGDAGGVGEKP